MAYYKYLRLPFGMAFRDRFLFSWICTDDYEIISYGDIVAAIAGMSASEFATDQQNMSIFAGFAEHPLNQTANSEPQLYALGTPSKPL